MHGKQSSGYSLLRMHRHAANIYVDPTEYHAKADLHFPLEVKDSMENVMKIMEFSPKKDTNAQTSKGLHTVHGVPKLIHLRLTQLFSSCNNAYGRACWWREVLCRRGSNAFEVHVAGCSGGNVPGAV
uniref:Uncharacterized protein n=1 Tax=Molossus molossus TaxID=27622 RepID=A0A7J8FYM4_MOLMO|nr:hypothetical protein HJG59_008210 [Molossus molossus]